MAEEAAQAPLLLPEEKASYRIMSKKVGFRAATAPGLDLFGFTAACLGQFSAQFHKRKPAGRLRDMIQARKRPRSHASISAANLRRATRQESSHDHAARFHFRTPRPVSPIVRPHPYPHI